MSNFYRLETPDNKPEITLGLPYGSVTMKNGQIVPKSPYTATFTDLFKEIPDEVKNVEVKVQMETPVEFTQVDIKVEAPAKRKAGRPFGSTKKK